MCEDIEEKILKKGGKMRIESWIRKEKIKRDMFVEKKIGKNGKKEGMMRSKGEKKRNERLDLRVFRVVEVDIVRSKYIEGKKRKKGLEDGLNDGRFGDEKGRKKLKWVMDSGRIISRRKNDDRKGRLKRIKREK